MASIKRDFIKQKWEDGDSTEFPLVCETCLGDNPYVRMTKETHGKKCGVCENPFTVFAWQAGTKGRLKRVEICKTCAQAKGVCQVCIYDLQYGLPVKVRDKILRESADAAATGGAGASSALAVPQSNANRSWYTAQQQRAITNGETDGALAAGNDLAHAKLTSMARMEPAYERNLPKLCSFFARGECDRGDNCPFRHEMPKSRDDPMSKQNTKDRFYGSNDPVANKILGRKRKHEENQEQQKSNADSNFNESRTTVYVRLQGVGPYPMELQNEGCIRDAFYSFGEIVSVRTQVDRGQAFVEFTQPEAAELAIASMNRKELLGRIIYTNWARASKQGDDNDAGNGGTYNRGGNDSRSSGGSAPTVVCPMAPPVASSGGAKPRMMPSISVKPLAVVASIAAARRTAFSGTPVRKPGSYPSSNPNRCGSRGHNNDDDE